MVIAPLFVTAMESGPSDYQATAASLVTLSRMIGMALGLAALTAWGVEHFQGLTAGLELPLQQPGETSQEVARNVEEYQNNINDAGITLFQAFFRAAAGLMLAGNSPVPVAIQKTRRRNGQQEQGK